MPALDEVDLEDRVAIVEVATRLRVNAVERDRLEALCVRLARRIVTELGLSDEEVAVKAIRLAYETCQTVEVR